MVLFPYNHSQLRGLSTLLGRFRLAHSGSKGHGDGDAALGPCPIESQLSLCPAMYKPELTPQLLGLTRGGSADDAEVMRALRRAVRVNRLLVDGRTFRCFDDVVTVR
eukprot:4319289-Prymnesium_polylepis.1